MNVYKVPLREVARGVAQERNEKHPAWNEYHYAGNNRIMIALILKFNTQTDLAFPDRAILFLPTWNARSVWGTNFFELRGVGYFVQCF